MCSDYVVSELFFTRIVDHYSMTLFLLIIYLGHIMAATATKYTTLQQFVGKAAGEALTEKDVQKGLASTDKSVVKLARHAERRLKSPKVSKEEYSELNGSRILSSQIKMEAFSGGSVKSLINDSLPVLITDIKSFFNRFTSDTPTIGLRSNQRDFIKDVSKHAYLDIAPLTAYVPEGLSTTYLEYSKPLLESALHASGMLKSTLSDYTLFLGNLINNADSRLSVTNFTREHEKLERNRHILNGDIGDCFDKGSVRSEVSVDKVIDRNSDWEAVFNNINSAVKLIESVDRKALNKKIAESVTLLDIILKKIERDEFSGMSPEGINNLSMGAYQMASELEFFSITYYRILALATSVDNTLIHYNKVMKK